MNRSGEGGFYERLEVRERKNLEDDIRPLWDAALSSKVVQLPPLSHVGFRNRIKSLSRQSPATRSRTLCLLNRFTRLVRGLGYYEEGFHGVLKPTVLHDILMNHTPHLRGYSKWNLCRMLWRVGWEFYKEDFDWILVGGRRCRAAGDEKNRAVDPDLPEKMIRHALSITERAGAARDDGCSGGCAPSERRLHGHRGSGGRALLGNRADGLLADDYRSRWDGHRDR